MEDLTKNYEKRPKKWLKKVTIFIGIFSIVFTLTFSTLYLFKLVPTELLKTFGRYPESKPNTEVNKESGEFPQKIIIEKIGVDSEIYNPTGTSTKELDDFLNKGAVRYPGSGLLGGVGNILIFGHSTGFRIVQNQAYKTFNKIGTLIEGDLISVFSENYEYVYKVKNVKHVSADKALIEFDVSGKLLTLSTCDSFGKASDRFIVEAELVNKKEIKS